MAQRFAADEPPAAGGAEFATTHWSVVAAAGGADQPQARRALETLAETYWYPLYAYVRRRGYAVDESRDLTQGFFLRLLERNSLQLADPARGRFRSFLLTALKNFLANEWRRATAERRGGGRRPWSLDFQTAESRYRHEPSHELTAEKVYERRWAMTLLEQAVQRLQEEFAAGGKRELFDELKGYLGGDAGAPYREVAERLGMTEAAVKVAVHRLRRRCRELLRDEVAQTVDSPEEIDAEMRELFGAVS